MIILYEKICCSSLYFTISIYDPKWENEVDFRMILQEQKHTSNRVYCVSCMCNESREW
jgi:hypothetical protein